MRKFGTKSMVLYGVRKESMKVRELIEKLKEFDEDLSVKVRRLKRIGTSPYRDIHEIKKSQYHTQFYVGITIEGKRS